MPETSKSTSIGNLEQLQRDMMPRHAFASDPAIDPDEPPGLHCTVVVDNVMCGWQREEHLS